ncbi:MAG: hypothetical protein ACKVS6_05080 [Planctomycetota bacterium]
MGSTTKQLLLGILLGAIAGTLITFLTFSGAQNPAGTNTTEKTSEPSSELSQKPRGLAEAEQAAETSQRKTATKGEEPAPADPSKVKEYIGKANAQIKNERGEGIISGTVKDAAGQPLANMTIRLQPRVSRAPRANMNRSGIVPKTPTLEESVRDTIDYYQRTTALSRQTLSAADGHFSFGELANQTYTVEAFGENYTVEYNNASFSGVRPGDTIHFVAIRLVGVPVEVLEPDGSVAKTATIVVSVESGGSTSSQTHPWSTEYNKIYVKGGSPFFVAIPDEATFTPAGGPMQSEISSDKVSVTVSELAPPELIRLQLKERIGIICNVRMPSGDRSGRLEVRLLECPPGSAPDLKLLATEGQSQPIWDHLQKVSFLNLMPGTYAIGAKRGSEIVAHEIVTLVNKAVNVELTIPEQSNSDLITVRATSSAGTVVSDLRFNFRIQKKNRTNTSSMEARRQPNGDFLLSPPDAMETYFTKKWDSGTRVFLTANSTSMGRKEVELVEGQKNVQIVFMDPAKVKVIVAGYKGSGQEGKVTFGVRGPKVPAAAGDRSYRGTSTTNASIGADGTGVSNPVEPGDYDILLYVSNSEAGIGGDTAVAATRAVTLVSGENVITIPLVQLYTVTVRFPSKPSGTVGLRKADDDGISSPSSQELDDNGIVTFKNVAAGEYTITPFFARGEFMKINVPTSGTIEFQASKMNAFRIRIRDSNGSVAKAGFQNGDLIIGIDGKDFEDINSMTAAIMQASAQNTDCSFRVNRNNSIITISCNAGLFENPTSSGASFEPASR